MAEAPLRTRLEAAQARASALRLEEASLPEKSPRHLALMEQVEEARRRAELEEGKVAELRQLELEELARQEPRDTSQLRRRWWMSPLAPLTLFVAPFVAFQVASWALDVVSWPQFGARWQWYVAAIPLVVNGLRVARGAWRRRRSRKG
jgi:hypothetical protein